MKADLTVHDLPTLFGRWAWMAVPVMSDFKRTPVEDFNSFSIMFYYISTTYKKIGDLFCPVIFWTFAQCAMVN